MPTPLSRIVKAFILTAAKAAVAVSISGGAGKLAKEMQRQVQFFAGQDSHPWNGGRLDRNGGDLLLRRGVGWRGNSVAWSGLWVRIYYISKPVETCRVRPSEELIEVFLLKGRANIPILESSPTGMKIGNSELGG